MRENSLDDLILALHSVFLSAQASIKEKQAGRIRTTFAVDASGSVRFPVMSFIAPGKVPGTATVQDDDAREMPRSADASACVLPQVEGARLSLLRLEFDCELDEGKRLGSRPACAMLITPPGQPVVQDKCGGRMEIVFHDTGPSAGQVRVNGELLADIPLRDPDCAPVSKVPVRRNVFRRLRDAWQALWPNRRFVMTTGQKERFREIVGTAMNDDVE